MSHTSATQLLLVSNWNFQLLMFEVSFSFSCMRHKGISPKCLKWVITRPQYVLMRVKNIQLCKDMFYDWNYCDWIKLSTVEKNKLEMNFNPSFLSQISRPRTQMVYFHSGNYLNNSVSNQKYFSSKLLYFRLIVFIQKEFLPFRWQLTTDWVRLDFYHLVHANIQEIWQWKIKFLHWNGSMIILNVLAAIRIKSLLWAIVVVGTSTNFKFLKVKQYSIVKLPISGGVSIELLMISTQSKHLFQKAIMMSGSALDPWIPTRMEHSSIIYDLGNFMVMCCHRTL